MIGRRCRHTSGVGPHGLAQVLTAFATVIDVPGLSRPMLAEHLGELFLEKPLDAGYQYFEGNLLNIHC
jgi:hypothetical protein